jgi:hypothetical protein
MFKIYGEKPKRIRFFSQVCILIVSINTGNTKDKSKDKMMEGEATTNKTDSRLKTYRSFANRRRQGS